MILKLIQKIYNIYYVNIGKLGYEIKQTKTGFPKSIREEIIV